MLLYTFFKTLVLLFFPCAFVDLGRQAVHPTLSTVFVASALDTFRDVMPVDALFVPC